MPVPWEALIPFGLVTAMFAGAGTLLNVTRRAENNGYRPRWSIDNWDAMMMDRDARLTGHMRKQSTESAAPEGFATNSQWYSQTIG